jgi:hypothetical protein
MKNNVYIICAYVHAPNFTIIHDLICCEIWNYIPVCCHMARIEKHCVKGRLSGQNSLFSTPIFHPIFFLALFFKFYKKPGNSWTFNCMRVNSVPCQFNCVAVDASAQPDGKEVEMLQSLELRPSNTI